MTSTAGARALAAPRLRPPRGAASLVVGLVLTFAALAVPAYAYVWASADDTVADRHGAPDVSWSPSELEELVGGDGGVPGSSAPLVLTYHDVQPEPTEEQRLTVTPQQLTDHLAMLDAAGYTSITARQFRDWVEGKADLPARPVLLTFDDGTGGLWRYADAVLEEHDFHAVAFVVTERLGTRRPYYLTWQEVERLERSGRWDIESHTKDGHHLIEVDAEGNREPFMINRRWLGDEDRLETREEFEARIRRDLRGSLDDLRAHDLRPAGLFSYPFSAATHSANDPLAPDITAAAVADVFAASMTNVLPDRLVTERYRRQRELPRVEVFQSTGVEDLHARITAAAPTDPGPEAPLTEPAAWTDSTGEPLRPPPTDDVDQGSEQLDVIAIDEGAGRATLSPEAGEHLTAQLAPAQSAEWTDYVVGATISGLGESDDGPTGSMRVLVGSDEPVQVAVSASYVQVSVGELDRRRVVAQQALEPADAHRVAVEVAGGEVSVAVGRTWITRFPLETGATGGLAIGASHAPVAFSSMRIGVAPS